MAAASLGDEMDGSGTVFMGHLPLDAYSWPPVVGGRGEELLRVDQAKEWDVSLLPMPPMTVQADTVPPAKVTVTGTKVVSRGGASTTTSTTTTSTTTTTSPPSSSSYLTVSVTLTRAVQD